LYELQKFVQKFALTIMWIVCDFLIKQNMCKNIAHKASKVV